MRRVKQGDCCGENAQTLDITPAVCSCCSAGGPGGQRPHFPHLSEWSPLSEPLKALSLIALSPVLVFSQKHPVGKAWVGKSSDHPSLFLHLLRPIITPALCLSLFPPLREESTEQDRQGC